MRLKGAELDEKALDLRRSGLSFTEIAQALDLGRTTAWRAYHRALARNPERATVEEARDLELQRLDKMLAGLWPSIERGDHLAVDRALKISQRRSRLLGLDAAPASASRGEVEHEADPTGVSDMAEFRRRKGDRRRAGPA